jgi:hypothetical protein
MWTFRVDILEFHNTKYKSDKVMLAEARAMAAEYLGIGFGGKGSVVLSDIQCVFFPFQYFSI